MYKLRVVHLGKFYPPHMGGIETHLQTLCREQAKSADVTALVANDAARTIEEMDGGVRVRRLGTQFHISSAPVCASLAWEIGRSQPDVLHLHLPNPIATMAVLASGYSGPVVITYHSDVVRQRLLGQIFEPFLQRILERSAAVICTSERYRDTSPALAGFAGKCVVIPYGIPPASQNAANPAEIAALRERFGPGLILAVGRLVYYKGFEYLIEAMRWVQGKLLIVGDGPLRGALEARIAERNLHDRVVLLGEIQNDALAPYYHAADVFALPSVARSEAFGIVQLEAMACGLPVVNTNLDSGVPSVSRHNETGLTVPPRDPLALAEAIRTLLSDRALHAWFSTAARRRVAEEFTAEVMATRVNEVYGLLAVKRHPEPAGAPAPITPPPISKGHAAS